MPDYNISTMARSDLDTAVEWATREGWNPGLHDADAFYATDPNGFFIGRLDSEAISVISGVRYGDDFGFLGFYIVKPEYRHKGYGLQLWRHAMAYLQGRKIALDGVVEQQHNYRKSGFRLHCRNRRYEGTNSNHQPSVHAVPASSVSFERMAEYDRAFFPAPRGTFLKNWLTLEGSDALAYMDNNEIRGYGVIRECGVGYKVGPLFADNVTIAEQLLGSLLALIPQGSKYYLDVTELNQAAIELAEKKYNMTMVFETARMYTGDTPSISPERTFGITTFELG